VIIGAGTAYNNLAGNSNNYQGQIREQELSFSSFLKLNLGKWIGNLGLRREFYNGTDPGLLYTMGWRYKAKESLIIRTHISNKFRKPSFNEKYWQPGGNPDLRPEKGWGTDIGIEGQLPSNALASSFRYSITGFYQNVDNWIQWVIQDSLTPVEYKTIRSLGTETELTYQYKSEELMFTTSAVYNLNRSVIVRTYDNNPLYEGNQLMYIPLHAAKLNFYCSWKGWNAAWNLNASGKRETVDSNDESLRLPGYLIINAMAGFEMDTRSFSCFIGFRIENLMNTQYEIIRAYPMPGRAYYITLSAGLNKQQTNH
jgi:iron complex outermembrane receptor protein